MSNLRPLLPRQEAHGGRRRPDGGNRPCTDQQHVRRPGVIAGGRSPHQFAPQRVGGLAAPLGLLRIGHVGESLLPRALSHSVDRHQPSARDKFDCPVHAPTALPVGAGSVLVQTPPAPPLHASPPNRDSHASIDGTSPSSARCASFRPRSASTTLASMMSALRRVVFGFGFDGEWRIIGLDPLWFIASVRRHEEMHHLACDADRRCIRIAADRDIVAPRSARVRPCLGAAAHGGGELRGRHDGRGSRNMRGHGRYRKVGNAASARICRRPRGRLPANDAWETRINAISRPHTFIAVGTLPSTNSRDAITQSPGRSPARCSNVAITSRASA